MEVCLIEEVGTAMEAPSGGGGSVRSGCGNGGCGGSGLGWAVATPRGWGDGEGACVCGRGDLGCWIRSNCYDV